VSSGRFDIITGQEDSCTFCDFSESRSVVRWNFSLKFPRLRFSFTLNSIAALFTFFLYFFSAPLASDLIDEPGFLRGEKMFEASRLR